MIEHHLPYPSTLGICIRVWKTDILLQPITIPNRHCYDWTGLAGEILPENQWLPKISWGNRTTGKRVEKMEIYEKKSDLWITSRYVPAYPKSLLTIGKVNKMILTSKCFLLKCLHVNFKWFSLNNRTGKPDWPQTSQY